MKSTLKTLFVGFVALAAVSCCKAPEVVELTSPDGTTTLSLNLAGDALTWAVERNGVEAIAPSKLAMELYDGTVLGAAPEATCVKTKSVTETIEAPFYRQAEFTEEYNEALVRLKGNYAVRLRAYNSGVAYRFETKFGKPIVVKNEVAEFNFSPKSEVLAPYTDGYSNAFQHVYTPSTLAEMSGEKPVVLPLYVDMGQAGKALVCEADLEAYPGMFLRYDGQLMGEFAPLPDSTFIHHTRCMEKVATRHDYIASVEGKRSFPWRIVALADEDTELPVNNLVYALGSPNRIGDCSWVVPGKSAWEWWNDWGLTNVDFTPGINNQTYKYYIDFAAKYGLEYVILDEGWSNPKEGNIMGVIDEIDLPMLVEYASERGVNLLIWAVANVLDEKLEEACAHYAAMGIKGFKIDFIDRDDQFAVERIYRICEAAARHHLVLDIHGIYKPTGINRTFPNIVNFEGVFGLEELKWSNPDQPEYDVTFPYIRMVQGFCDYTQGAYRNAYKDEFKIDYYNPMSQGTRAHQAALYVVCDAPVSMLCDSPSLYEAEADCTEFIASIHTKFEQTTILSGKVGESIVTARKADGVWYVGGMTDWSPRTVEVDFSFLGEGEHTAQILSDVKGGKATDYHITSVEVDAQTKLAVELNAGGGFVMIVK